MEWWFEWNKLDVSAKREAVCPAPTPLIMFMLAVPVALFCAALRGSQGNWTPAQNEGCNAPPTTLSSCLCSLLLSCSLRWKIESQWTLLTSHSIMCPTKVQCEQTKHTLRIDAIVILSVSEASSLRTSFDEWALSTICSTSCLKTMLGPAGPITEGNPATLACFRNGPGSQDFFT